VGRKPARMGGEGVLRACAKSANWVTRARRDLRSRAGGVPLLYLPAEWGAVFIFLLFSAHGRRAWHNGVNASALFNRG